MDQAGVIYSAPEEEIPEEDIQRLKRIREYNHSIDSNLAAIKALQEEDRDHALDQLNKDRHEDIRAILEDA